MPAAKSIVVLGSTGSIGRQTLEVVEAFRERFRVLGLSAGGNLDLLVSQWERFRPPYIGLADAQAATAAKKRLPAEVKVLAGVDGLCELASLAEADIVLGAISGMAGLPPIFAAARAGKCIAIANKEPLVTAGELLKAEAARAGAELVPVDSEHSALFQLLEGRPKESVARVVLTGSGGPFLEAPEDLSQVTPQQALAHPTWRMGPKVTVDSATLMNKGLEVIEAHRLFDIALERIDVIIHPQSIIHSMVEFVDGAMLAHLAAPDMRIPIQYALGLPERWGKVWSGMDLATLGKLTFAEPNLARFPCLGLAREAARRGGTAPAVMNAADEVAVEKFLAGEIDFAAIARVVEEALAAHEPVARPSLEEILQADQETRERLRE